MEEAVPCQEQNRCAAEAVGASGYSISSNDIPGIEEALTILFPNSDFEHAQFEEEADMAFEAEEEPEEGEEGEAAEGEGAKPKGAWKKKT